MRIALLIFLLAFCAIFILVAVKVIQDDKSHAIVARANTNRGIKKPAATVVVDEDGNEVDEQVLWGFLTRPGK
jgi:cytochrome oxidase Cu insertion factor (SCO1/SenC/PrrC family)